MIYKCIKATVQLTDKQSTSLHRDDEALSQGSKVRSKKLAAFPVPNFVNSLWHFKFSEIMSSSLTSYDLILQLMSMEDNTLSNIELKICMVPTKQIHKNGWPFLDPNSGVSLALQLQHPDIEEVDWLSGNCSAAWGKNFFSCLE